MNAFTFSSAATVSEALADQRRTSGSAYLGGGTNLIDDWKLGVQQPEHLIDVRNIGTSGIKQLLDHGLRIGGGTTNTAAAYDPNIRRNYPALSQAFLAGASPQLRNAATVAGNLLQKTRCTYFRDTSQPCNKREPGSGCPAIQGINRSHAILGTSPRCIATHPSDMAVALMTFDAVVRTRHSRGERSIPIQDFFVPYGEDPARENVLEAGELVLSIDLPSRPWFAQSSYVKARDRASYEFALASAATALHVDDGVIRDCRISLGGIATKPWRAFAAEATIRGRTPTLETFRAAAEAELKSAVLQKDNAFKMPLTMRVLTQSLQVSSGNRKAPEMISDGSFNAI